jgi:hypothetical protein
MGYSKGIEDILSVRDRGVHEYTTSASGVASVTARMGNQSLVGSTRREVDIWVNGTGKRERERQAIVRGGERKGREMR